MTTADELTPQWAAMRAVLSDAFHADSYAIVRVDPDPVPDGYGGYIDPEPETVETGRCSLELTGRGSEGVRGTVVVATSPYTAELPIDSVIEETDTLTINGRSFDVVSVARGGSHDLFTTVGLEERGA